MSSEISFGGVQCDGIDLSYAYDDTTIFWPGGEKYKLCMECSIDPNYGYSYAAGVFSCAEHGGTHVDAPFHFSSDGITVDLIPITNLIASCNVIDISDKCSLGNPSYELSVDDITIHEREHGKITENSIVLVRTGWSRYWKDGPKSYLGFDESVDGPYECEKSALSFPGLSADAARWFVHHQVAAVGLDTGKNTELLDYLPT